jgi:hypothetical protein
MWPLSNITSAQNQRTATTTPSSPHPHIHQRPQNRIVNSVMTTTNPLFCQMVGCVAQQYDTRSQSPTVMKRNLHCFTDHSLPSPSISSHHQDEVELVYSYPIRMHNQNSSNCGNSNSSGSSSKKLKSASTTSAPSVPSSATSNKKTKSYMKKDSDSSSSGSGSGSSNVDAVVNMSPKKSHRSKKKKSVSFNLIEVREHPRILGDNPSAKKGPPLSIGCTSPPTDVYCAIP